jgi:hypothetical protein
VADQVPFQRQVLQRLHLGQRFLHIVLAEGMLALRGQRGAASAGWVLETASRRGSGRPAASAAACRLLRIWGGSGHVTRSVESGGYTAAREDPSSRSRYWE